MNNNKSKTENKENGAGVFLRFLYRTVPGRILLRLLSARWVSSLAGAFLSSRGSRFLIKPFVKSNGINLSEYISDNFSCFNDCFSRKIKPEKRPFSDAPGDLCSPCDGLLSAYTIEKNTVFPVKQTSFTVDRLLGDADEAEKFYGGTCLVIRLCVDNYHRYAFFDSGNVLSSRFIPGKLHTVRPIALEKVPVFTENCRECTLLETDNFGICAYIEVGAMLVGKIKNRAVSAFRRGEEKGTFLYGGSTVILLFAKDSVSVREEYFNCPELPVKMGEKLN